MRNRQVSLQKRIVISVFAGVACLFFFACGIPIYYVIEPPQAENIPTYETDEPSKRYFGLTCPYTSSSENSDFTLNGTEIYYRIYNNVEEMKSDISSINGSNSEYSENGYRQMTGLDYKVLSSSNGDSPIIKKITSTRTIQIWLCTEGDYSPKIFDVTNNTVISTPYRNGSGSTESGSMSFDFTTNNYPKDGDLDTKITEPVEGSGEVSSGEWYINLYAVSVGRDTSLSQHYSSLLHLGNLKIRQAQ